MNSSCLPSESEHAFELDQHLLLIQGSLVVYPGKHCFSCTVASLYFCTVAEPVARWYDK